MSMKKHWARQYPQGKISADDEGAVAVRVAADRKRGVVVIDFRKPVVWFGLSKKQTLEFAALLCKHAEELPDVPEVNTPPAEGTQ